MGLHLREINLMPDGTTENSILMDTDWLQKQQSKRLFVFNILCIGNLISTMYFVLTLEVRLFANTYKDGMGHFDPCIIMLQNVNA